MDYWGTKGYVAPSPLKLLPPAPSVPTPMLIGANSCLKTDPYREWRQNVNDRLFLLN